jgi:dihydroxyacetone kinase
MAGISLSIMVVDDEHLGLLDAPCSAPAWPRLSVNPTLDKPRAPLPATPETVIPPGLREVHAEFVQKVTRACAKAAVAAEPTLTKQDILVCSPPLLCGTLQVFEKVEKPVR